VVVGTYFILNLCVRKKTHTLVSSSLIHRFGKTLVHLAGQLVRYLPLLWKVAIAYGILCLLELFGLYLFFWGESGLYVLWFLEKLVLGALVAYVALAFHRLKCGAEAIAAGDYNTQVDEKHLVLDFKDTAETLNHIQDGMSAAVDSRMKSERLKTELITNVSHDLKTPLTSIVSYVDLLKQEPVGSPAAGEYLEVLDRQSARLKKLIEDLVEASKASTGNITVQAEALDLSLLLGQALGEYNERLLVAQLSPVIKAPETPVTVFADGRLLWRIFDNLLGNAVKYALPGTRLYVTVTADTQATVTFRNISREPLDVSADELMERFVRGDSSRHTEGSGLGLSIARSLSESMGGTFQLSLDGDLFKATVSFPLAPENSAL
jgi:signal transduction histidine kinase